MARPLMVVVAGPPGSGKSSRFPVSSLGVASFNADARAAELFGSYHSIPQTIRKRVNSEFEYWIHSHIDDGLSFALETTLRSAITFEQARTALDRGFLTRMLYVCAGSPDESVRRVTERAYRGGHSASERLVRNIYARSTANLLAALAFDQSAIEQVRIYDNSEVGGRIRRVMTFRRGEPSFIASAVPEWLEELLRGTNFDVDLMRTRLKNARGATE